MARASAWGTGSALAFHGMEVGAQADLLCMFHAARVRDGEELTQAVRAGLASVLSEVFPPGQKNPGRPAPTGRREYTDPVLSPAAVFGE